MDAQETTGQCHENPRRTLKQGAFGVQGIGTYPTVKLMRKLGDLSDELLGIGESRVVMLLALPAQPQSG